LRPAGPARRRRCSRAIHGRSCGFRSTTRSRRARRAAEQRRAALFVDSKLDFYAERRNDPDADATSGLSPYLHFGHVSAHHVFSLVAAHEDWSPSDVARLARGRREGFWAMRPGAEAFLEQLLVWRELGYNFCAFRDDADRFTSLPEWARRTLARHSGDRRPALYSLERLEAAETGDELWNAAQRELIETGRIQNYLRMLWGKRVLEWTRRPEAAYERLVYLNDKYALDGRDPNSYSGISWCFGRYDRPWGPERPVFGSVRFMSSDATRRKLELRRYLRRFGRGNRSG
jgi:deoxyribodipyrimidine photo-lyase